MLHGFPPWIQLCVYILIAITVSCRWQLSCSEKRGVLVPLFRLVPRISVEELFFTRVFILFIFSHRRSFFIESRNTLSMLFLFVCVSWRETRWGVEKYINPKPDTTGTSPNGRTGFSRYQIWWEGGWCVVEVVDSE